MADDRILLDTTVQLWRITVGHDEASGFHRELVDKVGVYSTSLAFREFLNTIIADLRYVHRLVASSLRSGEDGRVGLNQLARFIATGQGNYSARSVKRLHLVIGMLLESFDRNRVSKTRLLVRLERISSRFIRDFFRFPGANGEVRYIHCLEDLETDSDEWESLRATRPFPGRAAFPRGAAEFLERRESEVSRVESAMRSSTKARGRDDKLLKALDWLKEKDGSFNFTGKLEKPKRWNWALGDLLIALETPFGVAIYSTDRTFRILCRALGKGYYQGYRVPG